VPDGKARESAAQPRKSPEGTPANFHRYIGIFILPERLSHCRVRHRRRKIGESAERAFTSLGIGGRIRSASALQMLHSPSPPGLGILQGFLGGSMPPGII